MATLKKFMGNAGAGLDESHGSDNLYDVLKALAEGLATSVTAYQATIATATIASFVADATGTLKRFRITAGTTGTADDTDVQVHLNGASQGELTIDNTDADGIKKVSSDLDVGIVAGDLIELVVSAAPTSGADLSATAFIYPVVVE